MVTGLSKQKEQEEDCYQTALEFLTVIKDYNALNETQFRARIGIATGSAIFGVIGRNRPKFDVWGKTFKLAQHLEETTDSGTISCCELTQQTLSQTVKSKLEAAI